MLSDRYLNLVKNRVCERLKIHDFYYVEIEAKKRVLPSQAKDLRKYLNKKADTHKSTFFLDQFLDTPRMELFAKGASMRLRYKKNGTEVYLQYKGPGYREDGLLYRSEFSSSRLRHLILEESHHDVIHFTRTPIRKILSSYLEAPMRRALREHLGTSVISRISVAPILCTYQKEKFTVKKGNAFLEPSLDRIFAFHINAGGLHPLSTFWEYENEIKAPEHSLDAKILHLPDLLEFDEKLCKRFDLKPEPLDKYHRCTSIFRPRG
ncbi:MAG: CYTH domain-containing protein [Elusimicrobia bacterium]|nr:CYTH domain-containing protein [Elusimicrobiota bacterium]